MKILLAQEYGTHPFWDRNRFEFIIVDTDSLTAGRAQYLPEAKEKKRNLTGHAFEASFHPDGVYEQPFACGSGFGKVPNGAPIKVIDKTAYDELIIMRSEEMEKARMEYQGSLQDNTDFTQE